MFNKYIVMSLNPIALKLYKTIDPVCKVGNEREYCVYKSAQEIFYYPFPTSGNPSTAVNTINCNPTSQRTIIDRKVYIRAKFTLNFSGSGFSGANLLVPGMDAPRSFPLSKCIKSLSVSLGDQQISTNLNEYFSCLERYSFTKDIEDYDFACTPSMPDQYSDYNSGFAANNNPLGYYASNSTQQPRGFGPSGGTGAASSVTNGAPVWYNIVSNTPTSAQVVMTVTEPVFLSPLYFGKGEHSGIIGIQSFLLQIQFDSLQRLWSHVPNALGAAQISSNYTFTVAINELQVLVKQLTPDSLYNYPKFWGI
jgi:hypothetical protein